MTQDSAPVSGGDGLATVELSDEEAPVLQQMAARTQSIRDDDPLTGAELGSGEVPADGAADALLDAGAAGPTRPTKESR